MCIYLSTQADTDNCTCWHHLHRSHHSCTCVQGSHPRSPRSCVPWSLGREIKWYDTGNREVTVVVIISVLFLTFPKHLITSTSCYTNIDKLMYTVKWAVKRFSGCWVFIILTAVPTAAKPGPDRALLQRAILPAMFACFIISHGFNDFLFGERHFLLAPQRGAERP